LGIGIWNLEPGTRNIEVGSRNKRSGNVEVGIIEIGI
jgi:hypothetical protein